MEIYKGKPTFAAANEAEWRHWLQNNHSSQEAVWLIIAKKDAPFGSVTYSQAVDQALCYGWIDSVANKRDQYSYYQYFAKRKPKSNWSKVNKEKVAQLTLANLMAEPGLDMVRLAKSTGTWDALNDVDNLILPQEMEVAFDSNRVAMQHWQAFPDSIKRGILEWIYNAKTTTTKTNRIIETVTLASQNKRANQYNR